MTIYRSFHPDPGPNQQPAISTAAQFVLRGSLVVGGVAVLSFSSSFFPFEPSRVRMNGSVFARHITPFPGSVTQVEMWSGQILMDNGGVQVMSHWPVE